LTALYTGDDARTSFFRSGAASKAVSERTECFAEENMDICDRYRRVSLIIPFSNVGKLRHHRQSIFGLTRQREICPKRPLRRTYGIEQPLKCGEIKRSLSG
jgi:hypothetical protein